VCLCAGVGWLYPVVFPFPDSRIIRLSGAVGLPRELKLNSTEPQD